MKEGGSSDVKCAYEGSGRKKQRGGEGGSPLRVFFRASPLICPVIILGKRKDHKGRKGLFKVTLWLHWQHPHPGGASGHPWLQEIDLMLSMSDFVTSPKINCFFFAKCFY